LENIKYSLFDYKLFNHFIKSNIGIFSSEYFSTFLYVKNVYTHLSLVFVAIYTELTKFLLVIRQHYRRDIILLFNYLLIYNIFCFVFHRIYQLF